MKVALYKGNSIINKLIRLFTRGNYNHVSVIFEDGTCVEANPVKGIYAHKQFFDDVKQKNYLIEIYTVDQTPEQNLIMEDFVKRQIGKKYDFMAFLGFLFYATKETRKSSNKWMCSELSFATFQKAGINLLDRVDAWKVSPTTFGYSPKLKYQKSYIVSNGKIVKEF
jgi:uncharacterized protein YycO